MKFIRKNRAELATIFFSFVMGILLLMEPSVYAIAMIRLAGALLLGLGIFDVVKYFRTEPEMAAKGSAFYSGLTLFFAGCFCLFSAGWFLTCFPVLAVLYGLMQILVSFRKLQGMMDAFRTKQRLWDLRAVSACITLLFGLLIALNPNMTFVNIWVFTGVTLLIEGVFDCIALVLQQKMLHMSYVIASGMRKGI